MWWKLLGVAIIAAAAAVAVIPIKTRAIAVDLDDRAIQPAWSVSTLARSMYFTPGTVAVLLLILAIAGFVAFKVARGNW